MVIRAIILMMISKSTIISKSQSLFDISIICDRDRIRQAIGRYDDILTTLKKRKIKWFGHVSRSAGLATTILRRDRQKKRWENNIFEWTGLTFFDARVSESEFKT